MSEVNHLTLRVGDLYNAGWGSRAGSVLREICQLCRASDDSFDFSLAMRETETFLETGSKFAKEVNVVMDGALAHLAPDTVVFEGAQGMLLDRYHGFFPHVTRSDCSFRNAQVLCWEAGIRNITKIGVARAYWTRHGAGPFPTEDPNLSFPDHNAEGEYQGKFRFGYFDLAALRYAARAVGDIDYLALTRVDDIDNENDFEFRDFPRADHQTIWGSARQEFKGWSNLLRRLRGSGLQVGITSHGPTAEDKFWAARF